MKGICCFFVLLAASASVLARPAQLAFQDNSAAAAQDSVSSTTLPPFPTLSRLSMKPDELNALMLDDNQDGYVYNRPDTPFEESQDKFAGYVYDRPKNPMTLPTPSTTSTTASPEEVIVDLPDGVARIL